MLKSTFVHIHIQMQKRLTNDEVKEVVNGYQNGETVYELAFKFGCHRTTISTCLKRNGVQPTIRLDLDVAAIIELYNNDAKIADIARRFKVSDSTIRKRLIENSVQLRSRWDY